MGRNTQILQECINVLTDQLFKSNQALAQLEEYFSTRLIVDAGDVEVVASYASQLRLRVTKEECGAVLDYMAQTGMVAITIDHTEDAINEKWDDRFIEPER